MTDHTTIQEIKATEEKLATLRAKLEAEQQPKFQPGDVLKRKSSDDLRFMSGREGGCYGIGFAIGEPNVYPQFYTKIATLNELVEFWEQHADLRTHTVPLSDLRALVEAHDPANGEAPPSYGELLECWKKRPLKIETNCGWTDVWNSSVVTFTSEEREALKKPSGHLTVTGPLTINSTPDWLDTTGATTDRSKFPALEPDCQFWRKADGKIVLPDGGSDGGADGRYLWPKSQSGAMVIAKHDRDYDGDEGPDHALVEYLGRVK